MNNSVQRVDDLGADLEGVPMSLLPSSPAAGRNLFVLGGGGALGAYQAGALRSLVEHGIVPDAMFGASVGALNAAFLASDPGPTRAAELVSWWSNERTHEVLTPSLWGRIRGMASAALGGRNALFDERPLRRLILRHVGAHDIAELAVPLTVTTTCLDCGEAVHHTRGAVGDVLVATCALPGLFPATRLLDGHRHVDGGVLCGVPVNAALAVAGPDDRVFVLDCALAPVTSRSGCAAPALSGYAEAEACGLAPLSGGRPYVAPVESHRGLLQAVLDSFTVARAAANRAAVGSGLEDPRVLVLPHVADAWAAGLLERLPAGPRDLSVVSELLAAGFDATQRWLADRDRRAVAAGDRGRGDNREHELS
jgi:predicted acylesterase/phospholipase RssA